MPKESENVTTDGRSRYSLHSSGKIKGKVIVPRLVERADLCKQCRKPIGTVIRAALDDPYCSAKCCRASHHVVDSIGTTCQECGCEHSDTSTPGCKRCRERDRKRARLERF